MTRRSRRILPPIQRRYVFVVDLRLSARRFQLDEVEQASVELIKDWSYVVLVDGIMVDPVTSARGLGISTLTPTGA
jgi:hypothetical protein